MRNASLNKPFRSFLPSFCCSHQFLFQYSLDDQGGGGGGGDVCVCGGGGGGKVLVN